MSYSFQTRSFRVHVAFLVVLGMTVARPLRSEQMPQITGETLSGRQILLPSASAGSVAIICIGFSHASQSQVKSWTESATKAFRQNNRVLVYLIAVLEDAPRFVRGMAVHGMKSRVPAQQKDHFIVVYQGESELKRITGFRQSQDAYVLLLDPQGEIKWVKQGPVTDSAFQELSTRVRSINGQNR